MVLNTVLYNRLPRRRCDFQFPSFQPQNFEEDSSRGEGKQVVGRYELCASTYSPVKVDGVLARHNVGDGGATALLSGLGVGGHFCLREEAVC